MPAIATGKYHNGYPPSAAIANAWVAQNLYLWGLATNTRDVFTGAIAHGNNDSGTENVGSWSFRYAGNTTLLCDIAVSGALSLALNIPNEGTAKHIVLGNGSFTTLDISGGGAVYTVGKEYTVTFTIFGNASATAGIYLLAAQIANTVLWPTLATLNDGTTPTETDYTAINTAQSNLLNIAQAPTGQGCYVKHINNIGNFDQFVAGSIYYRAQNTITITYLVQNGVGNAVLTVVGDAGWTDTFGLTVDGKEHTDTFTLSSAHYTANTFYRYTVGCTSTQNNYVDCISIGGVKSLTNPPQNFASVGAYRGSTGAPGARLKPVGGNGATDNLTEIAVALRGSPSIGSALLGFQFLSPVAQAASIYQTYQLGPSFRRPHILQYLAWKPFAAGQGGTVTMAVSALGVTDAQAQGYTFGLSDTQNGGWNVTELDSQPNLAYGMFYVVTGVAVCFEVAVP